MEQQFSEMEKRFVLAEAIKSSTIPVERLYQVLAEHVVIPDWEQMLLPNGRNLAQCKHAFESMRLAPHSQLSTPQPYPQTFLNPVPVYSSSSGGKRQSVNLQPGPDQKRQRKSGGETPTLARDLLPKPTNPNGGSPMSTISSSPAATTSQKKRGRPSKADVERKQREAIERGDIIPPAPTQSQAGPSGQDDSRPSLTPKTLLPAPTRPEDYPQNYGNPQSALTPGHGPQMVLEHGSPASMGGEPPGKKRKPRLPPKPKVQKPGEHSFSINPPVGQIGQGENAIPPVPAETSQAGPIAATPEAGNPPTSSAPATAQEPVPANQPKSDEK
ncbi:hypothetical protein L207DRAFT_88538 [Hyaloscypha variabilis F]|uniref:Uncharacterized protein n=1 Tax=Hyaloscypha variabilis (strain UAMH 11265 / GT02V1 / F) TaxID=1149755 RepID=A0A2J6RDX7_HYAVF|nr:hypothetical protein L207DRAFT_88538 [Hyaloscypha variabilis F]